MPPRLPKGSAQLAARVQTQIRQALELHQHGELDRARALYEDILESHPSHADALHLLGVLWVQREDYPQAIDLISRAIRQQPANAGFFYNRGSAYHRLGDMEAAVRDYARALELNPGATEASYNRGNAHFALGRWPAAIADYDRALRAQPAYAEAWCNRGVALQRLGEFALALASFDRAIELRENYAEAHCNRGACLRELKRPAEALVNFERAIVLRSDYAEAYSNRGITFQDLGSFEAARQDFERALTLRPDYTEARYGFANALFNLGRLDDALENYNRVIDLSPGSAEAYTNRGNLWFARGQFEAAIRDFDEVLRLRPADPDAYANRGNARVGAGQIGPAIADFSRAIELQPERADRYTTRGVAWQKLHRLNEAMADFERAIAHRPGDSTATWNKALVLLLAGDYANGWPLYETRWRLEGYQTPVFPVPRWTGAESLAGRTIFLYTEQGLGDTLQFCRYVPLLVGRGARVILEVQPGLEPLLRSLSGEVILLPRGAPRPPFDFECPLLSLPLAFRTELPTIPSGHRYLAADPRRVTIWREKLGTARRRRAGLAWRGNPKQSNDRNRSMNLSDLLPGLSPEWDYFSLQKDLTDEDKVSLHRYGIVDLSDELHDFADTAAVCEILDLVISVDTSVAHLSGALGRPTWVMLCHCPDWRWALGRPESAWYPSARLFRQERAGDWSPVTREVKTALEL